MARKRAGEAEDAEKNAIRAAAKASLARWHADQPKVSNAEIARSVRVDPKTIGVWESPDNENAPNLVDAALLCAFWGRTLDEMVKSASAESSKNTADLTRRVLGVSKK